VTTTGNTEEGSYADVIHFECVSIEKKTEGSSDIHCTETDELSDSVPKCKGSYIYYSLAEFYLLFRFYLKYYL